MNIIQMNKSFQKISFKYCAMHKIIYLRNENVLLSQWERLLISMRRPDWPDRQAAVRCTKFAQNLVVLSWLLLISDTSDRHKSSTFGNCNLLPFRTYQIRSGPVKINVAKTTNQRPKWSTIALKLRFYRRFRENIITFNKYMKLNYLLHY